MTPEQVSELRNVMSELDRVGLGGATTNFLPEQATTPVTAAPIMLATSTGNASPLVMIVRGRNHHAIRTCRRYWETLNLDRTKPRI